ncbi:MAG TPA: hypothetical protein VH117_01020 [Edaphobacter sp.]|jgi:hypothetical protein|nr:hypothetical protein [Edaphobacter sp.]
MAQGLNSTKTPARPSHEAIEDETTATERNKSDQERMDHAATQSAKRAQNRIVSNEETTPGNSVFTK